MFKPTHETAYNTIKGLFGFETKKTEKKENITTAELYNQFSQGELNSKELYQILAIKGVGAMNEFIAYHNNNRDLLSNQENIKQLDVIVKKLSLFTDPEN